MVEHHLTHAKPVRKGSYFGDEVFGNFKGRNRSNTEREDILRRLLPTATFLAMNEIPKDVLAMPTESGQKLRLSLLNNTVIIFFTAGYEGKRFIYEKAQALGITSIIFDQEDSWSRLLVDDSVISDFVPIDTSMSSDDLYTDCLLKISVIREKYGRVDGICTFAELSISMVSRLAETLGLPGHLPKSVSIARDKYRTRNCIASKTNYPPVKSVLVKSREYLFDVRNDFNYPVVVKPISGADSLGVKKVDDPDSLLNTFDEISGVLSTLVVSSGALGRGNDGSQKHTDPNLASIMVEEYLSGDEVDIDIVLHNSIPVYCQVVDNGPTEEPYFADTWASLPSSLPDNIQDDLKNMAVTCLRAMGFTTGVFHVEAKSTKNGPRLVEVNARMGGGPICQMHELVYGVDLVHETFLSTVGIPNNPIIVPTGQYVYDLCINSDFCGYLLHDVKLDSFRSDNIIQLSCDVGISDQIIGPTRGQPTMIAEIVAIGGEFEALRKDVTARGLAILRYIEQFCENTEIECRE